MTRSQDPDIDYQSCKSGEVPSLVRRPEQGGRTAQELFRRGSFVHLSELTRSKRDGERSSRDSIRQ